MYQIKEYSCYNHTFHYAIYVPHECHLRPAKDSLHNINQLANFDNNNLVEETPQGHESQRLQVEKHKQDGEDLARFHQRSFVHSGNVSHQAFKILARSTIYYIGDSLSAQMYIAGKCMLEEIGLDRNFNMSLIYPEPYLRMDVPCEEECLNHPEVFSNYKGWHNPCQACPDGKRIIELRMMHWRS